jgi:hypothetical protein
MKNGSAAQSQDERLAALESRDADFRLQLDKLCRKVDDVVAKLDVLIDASTGRNTNERRGHDRSR